MKEIEQQTLENWLHLGTVKIDYVGNENVYVVDGFKNEFFAKVAGCFFNFYERHYIDFINQYLTLEHYADALFYGDIEKAHSTIIIGKFHNQM